MSSLFRTDCSWLDHRNRFCTYASISWNLSFLWTLTDFCFWDKKCARIILNFSKNTVLIRNNYGWSSWSWSPCLVGNLHRKKTNGQCLLWHVILSWTSVYNVTRKDCTLFTACWSPLVICSHSYFLLLFNQIINLLNLVAVSVCDWHKYLHRQKR